MVKRLSGNDTKPTIIEEVESDPELKQELLKALEEVKEGYIYTTQEILDAIKSGKI